MTEPLVVSGLCKSFGGRRVVSDVSLTVAPGQIVGLLGPNGAGKTTTFKMILGLVTPGKGSVTCGSSLDRLPLHKRARAGLGYLPQGPSIFRGLSVEDNLLVLLETLGEKDPSGRATELLERFGVAQIRKQKASSLSGGERRRLELARALCSNPKILLMDEPFAGVDPIAVDGIVQAIGELANLGVGVLLTDHAVSAALSVCHRVYLIVNGAVVVNGTPDEMRQSDEARRLYLGDRI